MSNTTKSKKKTKYSPEHNGKERATDNTVSTYLNAISKFPLLTQAQEVDLALAVEQEHVSIMQLCCKARYKGEPELPGYQLIKYACRKLPEIQDQLGKLEVSILETSCSKALGKLSEEAFAVLPVDRYPILRTVASYMMTDDEFRKKYKVLSKNADQHHTQAIQYRNEFVRGNLRLAVNVARKFNYGRLPLMDLIQEGNTGLMKAVDRFDYTKGYKFSTYASWWIRHAISRAIADKGRIVRLPVHMIDYATRVRKSELVLGLTLQRKPTAEEVVAHISGGKVTLTEMKKYLTIKSSQSPISLDTVVNDEDGRSFIDFMEDVKVLNPLESIETKEEIRKVLSTINDQGLLKPFEIEVLMRRFGIGTNKAETLEEIGIDKSLSRERIRQVQAAAMYKVKKRLGCEQTS